MVEELQNFKAELEPCLHNLQTLQCKIDQSEWLLSTMITEKLSIQAMERIQHCSNTDYATQAQMRENLLEVINHLTANQIVSTIVQTDIQ